ncbi:MAG: serine/threonine protein kinase [Candidatus Obscuribacterales bacterium]|nr:serine/threonine protein kinase [Candidatus Obscuribacterales bacterium]
MNTPLKNLPAKTEESLPNRKLPSKPVAEEILVRYRPLVELEKWVKQRVDDRTANKTTYVVITTVLFAVFGLPLIYMFLQFILILLASITSPNSVGAAAVAAANSSLLSTAFMIVMGLLGAGTAYYYSLPTHLLLSKKGIKLLWRHRGQNIEGPLQRWGKITHMSIVRPKGKTSPLDHYIRFNNGSAEVMGLRLGGIPSAEERAKVLEAVETFSPELQRDAACVQALELPPNYSYTELWLQALSGPPKRERLTPLERGATLREQRYAVARQLGVGGQGTAYLAYDRELQMEVVLKEFILPVFVDVNVRRQSLERFEHEARILRQLDFDKIVSLIDFFVEDHRGYLVLEHIDGKSLRQIVIESGALPEKTVRDLTAQMCEIQSYMHNLTPPVVHRDFTPDNLILRKDGMLKLVDFNVAQQKETTATGTVVGKHAYLPPEQFRGQPTTQSDIYSMGASIFFLLTAQEPDPITTLHPREVNASVSEQLDAFVAKATQIELKDRYARCEDLLEDLKNPS